MRTFFTLLIFITFAVILLIFGPVIREELKYTFDQMAHVSYSVEVPIDGTFQKTIIPPDTNYSIIIPKINATAIVAENINLLDKKESLKALQNGIIQAGETAYPGHAGNVYLVAQLPDAFYKIYRNNPTFFLANKLEVRDEIDIYYRGILYKYYVSAKDIVDFTKINYANNYATDEKTLTLVTGYPLKMSSKRLIIQAILKGGN